MSSAEINTSLNNVYTKPNYYNKYSADIFITGGLFLLFIFVYMNLTSKTRNKYIQLNWNSQQCNPQYLYFSGWLKENGISKGDRVCAYMPNCPETIITMLATASLGAVFSSCSTDFGVAGVLDRFQQIEPKILVTVDGYLYNGKAIDLSKPKVDMSDLEELESMFE